MKEKHMERIIFTLLTTSKCERERNILENQESEFFTNNHVDKKHDVWEFHQHL